MSKPRTAEEIRDAVRAEIPALVALRKRLAAYYVELSLTPEYRRRHELEDEDPEAWQFDAAWGLAGTLCDDDLGGTLRDAIARLRLDTSPRRWAQEPERSRRHFEKAKASREAEEATAHGVASAPRFTDRDAVLKMAEVMEDVSGALRSNPSPERVARLADSLSELGAALSAAWGPSVSAPSH